MAISEAAIARIETGRVDPKISTLERFADALGVRVEWHLMDAQPS
jgi:predicted transcriptional regulator